MEDDKIEGADLLMDAVEAAAVEAKAVLVRHAKMQEGGDQVALVMMSTIELLGGMIGAGLLNPNEDIARATLATVDLYMPPLIEQLRRRVAKDTVKADAKKLKEEEANEQDRGPGGDAAVSEGDDQLPPAEDAADVAEPPVADGE